MIRSCRDCVYLEIHTFPVTQREIGRCTRGHYDGLHAPVTVGQWYSMQGIMRGADPTRAIAEQCRDRMVRR